MKTFNTLVICFCYFSCKAQTIPNIDFTEINKSLKEIVKKTNQSSKEDSEKVIDWICYKRKLLSKTLKLKSNHGLTLIEKIDPIINFSYTGILVQNEHVYSFNIKKNSLDYTKVKLGGYLKENKKSINTLILEKISKNGIKDILELSKKESSSGAYELLITTKENDNIKTFIMPSFVVLDDKGIPIYQ